MTCRTNRLMTILRVAPFLFALNTSSHAMAVDEKGQPPVAAPISAATSIHSLASNMKVGDIVFIRVSAKPFREVASATNSWTNHVGIVIDTSGEEPKIGESTFPLSRTTTLTKFVARSEHGRVAVARPETELSTAQKQLVYLAASRRSGILYDTGFDIHSHRQFCSRYVREVLNEATGVNIGEIETFSTLLTHRPETDLGFWKVWYFGHIPWERETVTPASLLA